MNKLDISTLSELSYQATVINFFILIILNLVLQQCYVRFGRSMTNRKELGFVFPIISMTTYLIIVVIKSSLALSLGLVGALSIVRFRTPIKEPESLGYLFLSIAIGLGLGADRSLITITITLSIIIFYIVYGIMEHSKSGGNLLLNLVIPNNDKPDALRSINQLLSQNAKNIHLRRTDQAEGTTQATYLLEIKDHANFEEVSKILTEQFPGIQISLVDQRNLLLG